tara:strand:+ start:1045 stop:1245 length:201 start_codon:yes stop_codon:yes gene_type:complete
MIYKFDSIDGGQELDVYRDYINSITLSINDLNKEYVQNITLTEGDLYDLIGCLHSLQKKINNDKNK